MFVCMFRLWFKMSGIQDSEAHFQNRAAEYGLPEEFVTRLRAQGVSTLGHLAFAIFRPGLNSKNVLSMIGQQMSTMGHLSRLVRQQLSEDCTLKVKSF